MNNEMFVTISTVALIVCLFGWVPILAIGKAIAMICEACHPNNAHKEDNPLEDVVTGK